MLVGLNDLVTVGAARTVRVGVLVPDPAAAVCVVVRREVVLFFPPTFVLVTEIFTVQLPLAEILMPGKLRAVPPAEKVLGVVPVQVPPTAPPAALMLTRLSE